MSFIGKFFITLFSVLAFGFLIIYLFRLANNSTNFIGLSDVYHYFNTNNSDLYNDFQEMIFGIKKIFNDFADSFSDTNSFITISSFNWDGIWEAISGFFRYLGNILVNGFKVLFFPVICAYDIIKFFVSLITFIFGFIGFIATY